MGEITIKTVFGVNSLIQSAAKTSPCYSFWSSRRLVLPCLDSQAVSEDNRLTSWTPCFIQWPFSRESDGRRAAFLSCSPLSILTGILEANRFLVSLPSKYRYCCFERLLKVTLPWLHESHVMYFSEMLQPSCGEISVLIASPLQSHRKLFLMAWSSQRKSLNQMTNASMNFSTGRSILFSIVLETSTVTEEDGSQIQHVMTHDVWHWPHQISSCSIQKKRLCSCVFTFITNRSGPNK